MTLKIIGAVFVIVGCGGIGFKIAMCQRKEEQTLRHLICLLDYMECELQYRLTPLPALCRQAAAEGKGVLRNVFLSLAQELEDQVSPDVERCMGAAICRYPELPLTTKKCLSLLSQSMGRFDVEGQLRGLENVRQDCRRALKTLTTNKEPRLRSYQTLGICAGAAIAIIFI